MRRYGDYFIALGVVAAWAVLSYGYLGIEDASSGLSMPGWFHGVFFLPGACLMQAVKGGHSNADLPFMAAISWILYSVLSVGIVSIVRPL